MTRTLVLVACGVVLLTPTLCAGQDRQQLQTFAELRQLQEEVTQLQLSVNGLVDAVKASNDKFDAKLDGQNDALLKRLADQKIDVQNISDSERALKSKLDQTNVDVSSLTQGLEGIRQAIAALRTTVIQSLTPPPADASDLLAAYTGASPTPPVNAGAQTAAGAPPVAGGAAATPSNPSGVSPQRNYAAAYADYVASQYDLAVSGFTDYLKRFPTMPDAANAQYYLGDSYFYQGKNKEAVQAYDTFITTYKDSTFQPDAYFRQASAYEKLGPSYKDKAVQNYQYLIKNFPNDTWKALAQQALDRMGIKLAGD